MENVKYLGCLVCSYFSTNLSSGEIEETWWPESYIETAPQGFLDLCSAACSSKCVVGD